jgi:hypothetical protein
VVFKIARFILYLALIVGLLFLFEIIHERVHTFMARLLGDPDLTFTWSGSMRTAPARCNIFDHTKISPWYPADQPVWLASTSLAGLGLMLFSAWRRLPAVVQRWSAHRAGIYRYGQPGRVFWFALQYRKPPGPRM